MRKQYPVTLDRIEECLAEDVLDRALPLSQIDESLRRAGADPDQIRRDSSALVNQLLDQRRLAWQDEARRRIARRAPLLERVEHRMTRLAKMTKDELIEKIGMLRGDARLAPTIATAFHKRRPEESSADDLRQMLEEFETLRDIEYAEKPEGEDS